ncbi:MAG: hypothetical protein CVU39_07555 [Chloroflexi bacterium HGW-Chloroflexi-10]|nr:MAG: hypothetical protein CVU39_07555 [Chloroflexi bacterium HGW-Chloroflexi-10]
MISGVLLLWLFVCMLYDLRFREVPQALTLVPLLIAVGYAGLHGLWLPAFLTVTLVFCSDIEPHSRRFFVVGVLSILMMVFAFPDILTLFILILIWALWEMKAMGGADAKLLMVIALVVPQPVIFLLIALAGGVQGLAALVLRRKEVPYIVAIFSGAALFTVLRLFGIL